jgi:hypothetical protein
MSIVVVVKAGNEFADGLLRDAEEGGSFGLIVVALFQGREEELLASFV